MNPTNSSHDHSRVYYSATGAVVAWADYNGTVYMPPCPEPIRLAHPCFRPHPIITDQEGQTLIGVAKPRKVGATVIDNSRFCAAVDESMAQIAAMVSLHKAFETAKTNHKLRIEHLEREHRIRMWILGGTIGVPFMLTVIAIFLSWLLR